MPIVARGSEIEGPLRLTSPAGGDLELIDEGSGDTVVRKIPRDQLEALAAVAEAANCGLGYHTFGPWRPLPDPIYPSRRIRYCERQFCSAKEHQMP